MRTARLALVFLACAAGVAAVPAADEDDKDVRAAVGRYFDAYGKRDLAAYDACLAKSFRSLQHPTRDGFLRWTKGNFEKLAPAEYKSSVKAIRREPGGAVVARVESRGTIRLKGTVAEVDDDGLWAMTLVKEGGQWKVTRILQAYVDVFGVLTRARTKAERLAILRAEDDDFLSLELIGNLDTELANRIEAGDFQAAESIQLVMEEAAAAIRDEDDSDLWTTMCLLSRGRVELMQARYKNAVDAFEAARVRFKKKGWPNLEVAALSNLISARSQLGDFVGALEAGETARKAVVNFNPLARRMTEPALLGNLGKVYIDIGDYARAKKDLDESLLLAVKWGDENAARNARLNLAIVHQQQGRYAEAIRMFDAVIASARKAGHRRTEGQVLNNKGLALAEQGRIGEALRVLDEARKLAVAVKDVRGEAHAVGNLALLHFKLASYEDADRYLRAALAIYTAIGDKVGVARCRRIQGMMFVDAGNDAEADKAFAECLRAAKASGSSDALAQATFAIGTQHFEAREWTKAGDAFAATLGAYRKMGDPRRILLAYQQWLLVLAVTDDPRYDAEYIKFRLEAMKYNDPIALLATHRLTAMGAMVQKNWVLASAEAQTAIRLYEKYRLLVEDPHLQVRYTAFRDLAGMYLIDATARAERGDPAGAFRATERAKSRSLTDLLERSRVPVQKGMTAAERESDASLRGAVTAAAHIVATGGRFLNDEPGKLARVENDLREAEAKYEAFRRRVFLDHPELRAQRGELPDVDLVALQKSVFAAEPDLAILSYLVAFDRVLIAVVTAGDKPDGPARVAIRSTTVGGKELSAKADRFWKACQNPRAGRPLSDDLYEWLIEPAEKDIAGKKHLLVVPCHPLLAVPFQALAPSADDPYLIERFAVSYAPSVSALLEMRRRGDRVRGPGRADRPPVVAVGGVTFTRDLKPLPASGPEAKAVAEVCGDRSVVLLAGKATRADVLEALPAARYIHIATHGLVNPPRPLFSALAVTPAGADDDGRLYAHDVMNMNLTAELAVLSACETGRGRDYRGEGTVGLAWAFFVAGVPAVVVSQWSVADDTTAELMRAFYARLAVTSKASKAEALRQAALALLKERETRHPMYWAPFVLTGDWRK